LSVSANKRVGGLVFFLYFYLFARDRTSCSGVHIGDVFTADVRTREDRQHHRRNHAVARGSGRNPENFYGIARVSSRCPKRVLQNSIKTIWKHDTENIASQIIIIVWNTKIYQTYRDRGRSFHVCQSVRTVVLRKAGH